MFKKTMMIIVIIAIALMLIFGCGKEDNPFDPNRGGYNDTPQENLSFIDITALNPGIDGEIVDVDPSTGEIIIYFLDFMDASTVNTSNIIVRDTTNGTSITGATLTYYPEIKKAVFRGTFSDDAVFVVTLKSDLRNNAGIQLDGNDNGLIDGSPYDDYRYRLYTGTGNVGDVDFVHPEIDWVSPGIENSVSLTPIITVIFTPGDVDTNDLTLSNFGLMRTSSEVAVTCSLVGRTPGILLFQPTDSLDEAEQYTVTVNCANVFDEDGNVLLGFVGENDGWVANIPDYTWDFITEAIDTLLDGEPPQVSVAYVSGEELVVRFDDDMDTSTFTTTNIKVFNNATKQNLVGSIINEYDGKGFRYTLENAVSGTLYKLWVSKDVKEAAPGNWYLDGNIPPNPNGVGGEWNDDYEKTFVMP
ncbi:hypothetical protein KAW96_07290 [candidate division WOR-3 bacterium]|nr:hypothetical protein [candidate division WOR-3 bacterium]